MVIFHAVLWLLLSFVVCGNAEEITYVAHLPAQSPTDSKGRMLSTTMKTKVVHRSSPPPLSTPETVPVTVSSTPARVPAAVKAVPDIPTPPEMHMFIDPPPLRNDIGNLDLIIIYNGYIYPKRQHWLELMSEQLDDFNCNGMAHRAKQIYISLTIDQASEVDKNAARLVNTTIDTLSNILPKAVFDVTLENRFEYPGLRNMWDVARSLPPEVAKNTIMVYLHSKGMVNTHMSPSFHGVRTPFEVNLFHKTFDRWPEVFAKFNKHPELNKAGCYPDVSGVMWYNVYYARASYVKTLINPTIHHHRFYYEIWLRYVNPEEDRIWHPKLRQIEFSTRNVKRKVADSMCMDCWSICAQNETLGVVYPPETLHIVEHPKLLNFDWYKCRRETVLPRPQATFSNNTQEHI